MDFVCSFSKRGLDNCQTLEVTDTSNYDTNTIGIDRNSFNYRLVEVRNILGMPVGSKIIPTGTDSVTFDISGLLSTNQLYLNIQISLVGFNSYTTGVGGLLPCVL